jgi:hypothetical protein
MILKELSCFASTKLITLITHFYAVNTASALLKFP